MMLRTTSQASNSTIGIIKVIYVTSPPVQSIDVDCLLGVKFTYRKSGNSCVTTVLNQHQDLFEHNSQALYTQLYLLGIWKAGNGSGMETGSSQDQVKTTRVQLVSCPDPLAHEPD